MRSAELVPGQDYAYQLGAYGRVRRIRVVATGSGGRVVVEWLDKDGTPIGGAATSKGLEPGQGIARSVHILRTWAAQQSLDADTAARTRERRLENALATEARARRVKALDDAFVAAGELRTWRRAWGGDVVKALADVGFETRDAGPLEWHVSAAFDAYKAMTSSKVGLVEVLPLVVALGVDV